MEWVSVGLFLGMAISILSSVGAAGMTETDSRTESGMTAAVIIADQPALLRLAFVLTGSRPYAEDIVQDVSEQALRKVGAPIEHPHAYLRTMVVNRVRQLGRRSRKEAELTDEIAHEDPQVVELADQLLKLRPIARTVLVLRYYEQWTVPEIARALKKPEGTIAAISFRALRHLRKECSNV